MQCANSNEYIPSKNAMQLNWDIPEYGSLAEGSLETLWHAFNSLIAMSKLM